ncbi:hypothetical protein ACJX0J_012929, partial [Zea mays]
MTPLDGYPVAHRGFRSTTLGILLHQWSLIYILIISIAELKDRGVEPDLYSYITLKKAYGKARMPEDGFVSGQNTLELTIHADTFVQLQNAVYAEIISFAVIAISNILTVLLNKCYYLRFVV